MKLSVPSGSEVYGFPSEGLIKESVFVVPFVLTSLYEKSLEHSQDHDYFKTFDQRHEKLYQLLKCKKKCDV